MKKMIKDLMDHLRYPSTWEGIIKFVAGVTGYNFAPDFATQMIGLGVAIAGIVSFFLSDADVKLTKK